MIVHSVHMTELGTSSQTALHPTLPIYCPLCNGRYRFNKEISTWNLRHPNNNCSRWTDWNEFPQSYLEFKNSEHVATVLPPTSPRLGHVSLIQIPETMCACGRLYDCHDLQELRVIFQHSLSLWEERKGLAQANDGYTINDTHTLKYHKLIRPSAYYIIWIEIGPTAVRRG